MAPRALTLWHSAQPVPQPDIHAPSMRRFSLQALGRPVFHSERSEAAQTVVVVPLFNNECDIEACLESVVQQDLPDLSLIVVDDASTDGGGEKALAFVRAHHARFARATVVAHNRNQGASMARNSGIVWSREPLLFMLDSDNRLRPSALQRLQAALSVSAAAFAYPQLLRLGDCGPQIGLADVWSPARLRAGNYIDTMALIRRSPLASSGGYATLADDHGWEDYELWCRFATLGLEGLFVPEILAEYRVNAKSRTGMQPPGSYLDMMAEMALRYPKLFFDG